MSNRKATFAKRQRETELKDRAKQKEAKRVERRTSPNTTKGPQIAWDEAFNPDDYPSTDLVVSSMPEGEDQAGGEPGAAGAAPGGAPLGGSRAPSMGPVGASSGTGPSKPGSGGPAAGSSGGTGSDRGPRGTGSSSGSGAPV